MQSILPRVIELPVIAGTRDHLRQVVAILYHSIE